MNDTTRNPAPNSDWDPCTDPPDLLQLQSLKFEHWYSFLLDLTRRFDGGMADFLQQPELPPDLQPMADLPAPRATSIRASSPGIRA